MNAVRALEPGAAAASAGIDLSLWLVDLDAAEAPDGVLPQAVLARAARFVREGDRRRYLASQAALRALVPHDISAAGPQGKPVLPDGPWFNLSRRDGWAAVARSSTHEVGVDLETLRAIDDARELAALHFSPGERAAVDGAADAGRDRTFLTVWTRKEACMKATGLGLTLAPSGFECGAGADARSVRVAHRGREWALQVHTLPSAPAPVVLSWAVVLR